MTKCPWWPVNVYLSDYPYSFYSSLLNIFTGSIHLPCSSFGNVFECNNSFHSLCKYIVFCTKLQRSSQGMTKRIRNRGRKEKWNENESRGNDISISFKAIYFTSFLIRMFHVRLCAFCSRLIRFLELFR